MTLCPTKPIALVAVTLAPTTENAPPWTIPENVPSAGHVGVPAGGHAVRPSGWSRGSYAHDAPGRTGAGAATVIWLPLVARRTMLGMASAAPAFSMSRRVVRPTPSALRANAGTYTGADCGCATAL